MNKKKLLKSNLFIKKNPYLYKILCAFYIQSNLFIYVLL